MSNYDDILYLSHPVSARRAAMPLADRAAQFSPFAALTGYEAVIAETGRLTDSCPELESEAIQELDRQLLRIEETIHSQPVVTVTYFQPDGRKAGGSIQTKTAAVRKVDTVFRILQFFDRTEIPFSRLLSVSGE